MARSAWRRSFVTSIFVVIIVLALSLAWTARTAATLDQPPPGERYRTENVIVAVMDGVHWARAFGDPTHELIPRMWNELRPQGTLYTAYYNNHVTITRAAHSTIASGTWQTLRNRGARSSMPAFYEYARDELKLTPAQAWVIFSKGPYAYAPNSSFPGYRDLAVSREIGLGEESPEGDDRVFRKMVDVMGTDRPRLIFANFGTTDHFAHSGVWKDHIAAVRHVDDLFGRLWSEIQQNPAYRDKTTLILTTDHGYHDDGVYEGFAEHGDSCEGCRHIMLLVLGPDVRKGAVVERRAYETDITPTVGELLGFQTPLAQGEVLKDCLIKPLGLNRKEARTELARRAIALNDFAGRELVRTLADRTVPQVNGGTKQATADTAMLLWGLLSAYDKLGDPAYLRAVQSWCEAHLTEQGDKSAPVGFVLAQLALRLRDLRDRARFLPALTRSAEAERPELEERASALSARDFAFRAILAASAGEVLKKAELWRTAMKATLARVRASERTGAASAVDDSWNLLTLAYVRSHGTGFKGETIPDVPLLREESLLQTYLVTDGVEPGELWPDPLQSALNVAAITEFRRRLDLFEDVPATAAALTWNDVCRVKLRKDLTPPLPGIDKAVKEIQRQITETMVGKVARFNYNVRYGFPALTDFDWARDLLRFSAERLDGDLLTGAFLLALENKRLIPRDPQVQAPRGTTSEGPAAPAVRSDRRQ